MSSPGAHRIGPVYFFDQPSKQKRTRGTLNILHFNLATQDTQLENTSQENDKEEGKNEEQGEGQSDETGGDGEPDSPVPMAALSMKELTEQVAPQLLDELAFILTKHKWGKRRRVPRGIENLLDESWKDLTAGRDGAEEPEGSPARSDEAQPRQTPPGREGKVERQRDRSPGPGRVGRSAARERQESANGESKRRKQRAARSSTTLSMSMLSTSCKHKGWIIQPQQPSFDGPEWIRLYQWVAERLEVARNLEKLQVSDQDLAKTQLMRYYDESKLKVSDRNWMKKAQSAALLRTRLKQRPKQQDTVPLKLQHKLNDGSSTIYYPSGYMAVCQSCSGLSRGGFYTNVFSDTMRPVVLATVTAFGHGTVTHLHSSAIKAVWHQDGGFKINQHGNVTEEWTWQTGRTCRKNVAIQVSDLISVRLFSGTSAILIFRCSNHSVQLPLSAVPYRNKPRDSGKLKLTSDAGRDILLEREMNPRLKPGPWKVLPLEKQVEVLKELSARKGKGENAGRDLRRLQHQVQIILNNWMDFYRVAVGIKCPDGKRMPGAPRKTKPAAALHSLNPPERARRKAARPSKNRKESKKLRGHQLATAAWPVESNGRVPRMERTESQQDSPVSEAEPHYVDVRIRFGSGINPASAEWEPPLVQLCPASFTPSIPVTLCPILLRAALQGEAGRRRCCCSPTQMPVLMDLEYDPFIAGQPPHSQQILVVCVMMLRQTSDVDTVPEEEVLEQLYRSKNKNRTAPCTQCQKDSFRLVKYEMSLGRPSCRAQNILLRKRHNAAPGMVLMYVGGKLLFIGYVFGAQSCTEKDLQKQISKTRVDYRLGLSLPSDYKFCDTEATNSAAGVQSSKILQKKEEKT